MAAPRLRDYHPYVICVTCMDDKAQLIRDFYAARARRDWVAVRELLGRDVVWGEAGEEDYSGEHRGREEGTALLQQLVEVTEGSFRLEAVDFVATAEHVATNVRWSAERSGAPVTGYDLAVYRIANGRIASAWFFPDGFDPDALSEVFSPTRAYRA
jgi:ketosteroid isomerase-like protein